MGKKLLNRDQIFEWLNPVLNADQFSLNNPTNSGDTISPLMNNSQAFGDKCFDIIDNPPSWMDSKSDDFIMQGNQEHIGAMYINGVPVTQWGAMYGGSSVAYQKANLMSNWFDIQPFIQTFMNNYVHKPFFEQPEELKLTNITIQKIVPSEAGLGINIYMSFKFNDTELFGKWTKWGIFGNLGYQFMCEPLKTSIPEESWIKVVGNIRKIIEGWLMPKSGIYKTLAKEIIIYSQLGQIGRLHKDDIIEVIKSDKEKILFIYKDQKCYIKTPTYWWFNYYFETIK
jgi:hypothetical protein